jgi:tripartite-type tricarboxylate transporter receptor subunit TctC
VERRGFLKRGVAGGLAAVLPWGGGMLKAMPDGSMTMIVPYPPGGIADARGRLMAEWYARDFDRSCIVENVPGAAGIVGSKALMGAEPDGLTVMSNTSAHLVVAPQVSEMEYVPLDEIRPVANVFANPSAVFVAEDSPYETLQDMLDDAKARPDQVTYGTIGVNSLYHLIGEALNLAAGVKMVHVPYSGADQYTIDLIAGRVNACIGTLGTIKGNPGQIRGLMLGIASPSKMAPEIPTSAQCGFPHIVMPDGAGLSTDLDVPEEIVAELSESLGRMVVDPAFSQRIAELGLESNYLGYKEYRAELDRQYKLIADLIAQAGLTKSG